MYTSHFICHVFLKNAGKNNKKRSLISLMLPLDHILTPTPKTLLLYLASGLRFLMAELPINWHFLGFSSLPDNCLKQKKIRFNWQDLFLVSPCYLPATGIP